MVFNTKFISNWEREKNLKINPKGYKIIIGLLANSEEQKATAIIAKLDAEKPKNFVTGDLPEGVYRLEHITFEGLEPMINRKLKELIK